MSNDIQMNSKLGIGTVRSDGKLRVLLKVPKGAKNEYSKVVLSLNGTTDGSAVPPSGNTVDVLLDYFGDEEQIAIALLFSESNEEKELYAYLLSNVGTYYQVGEGSPASFYFRGYAPTIETAELGDGRFRLSIYDLEQAFSKRNYNSIIVTKEKVEDGTSSDDLPSWWVSFPPTSSTSTKVDVNFFSDAFSDGTYYVYKDTKFGALYLIGKAKFESSQEPDVDVGDCKIDYDVIDVKNFVSADGRVEAYVENYIDITKEAWTKFCAAINILRTQSGLTEVDFISVSKNDPLTAEIWNQAMRAFEEVADANGGYFSLDKFLATRGTGITQELIDEVNSEIADVITELMTL